MRTNNWAVSYDEAKDSYWIETKGTAMGPYRTLSEVTEAIAHFMYNELEGRMNEKLITAVKILEEQRG